MPRTRQAWTQIGVHARSAVPALIQCVEDSNAGVQKAAAAALGKIDMGEEINHLRIFLIVSKLTKFDIT